MRQEFQSQYLEILKEISGLIDPIELPLPGVDWEDFNILGHDIIWKSWMENGDRHIIFAETKGQRFDLPLHWHTIDEEVIMRKGEMILTKGTETKVVPEGSREVIPALTPHKAVFTPRLEIEVILRDFKGETFSLMAPGLSDNPPPSLT